MSPRLDVPSSNPLTDFELTQKCGVAVTVISNNETTKLRTLKHTIYRKTLTLILPELQMALGKVQTKTTESVVNQNPLSHN